MVLAQHVPDSDCPPLQIEGSRRNIEEHYDAGNAMYKIFLDETMTYSSGIHRPGGPPCSACELSHAFTECSANSGSEDRLDRASHALRKHLHISLSTAGDSLKQAQLNKLDALIEKAGIKETDHVLEIGCGWGSMAIHAVQVHLVLTCICRASSMRTMCCFTSHRICAAICALLHHCITQCPTRSMTDESMQRVTAKSYVFSDACDSQSSEQDSLNALYMAYRRR